MKELLIKAYFDAKRSVPLVGCLLWVLALHAEPCLAQSSWFAAMESSGVERDVPASRGEIANPTKSSQAVEAAGASGNASFSNFDIAPKDVKESASSIMRPASTEIQPVRLMEPMVLQMAPEPLQPEYGGGSQEMVVDEYFEQQETVITGVMANPGDGDGESG